MATAERRPQVRTRLAALRSRAGTAARSPRVAAIARLPETARFAYPVLFLVQARALWGIWHREVTNGDTLAYLQMGYRWIEHGQDLIVWSPLYTDYYGSVVKLVGNNVTGTTVHRVLIVFAVSALVLALLRRLLPASIALLIACWWAVLPINFDTLYEIHLFSALPPLGAALLLTNEPGPWRRGIALGVLVACTILVRNEVLIVALLLAATLIVAERRARRRAAGLTNRRLALTAGVPLLVAVLLIAGAYERSAVKGEAARQSWHAKHALNVCQVYATNFQQRHPDQFTQSPWLDCQVLMQQVFHKKEPTLTEMWRENPKAMVGFTKFNLHMLPNGIQLGLFNSTAGEDNPDYAPADLRQPWAAVLTLLLLQLLAIGGVLAWRDRGWWRERVYPQRWAWGALGATSVLTLGVVVLLERPRPSYMFGLAFTIMAVTGIAATAVMKRLQWQRHVGLAAVAVPIALIVALPSHFKEGTPTPLKDVYKRTRAVADRFDNGVAVVPASVDGQSCLLVAPNHPCRTVAFQTAIAPQLPVKSLRSQLATIHPTVIYADASVTGDPAFKPLFALPSAYGFKVVRFGRDGAGTWEVLVPIRG